MNNPVISYFPSSVYDNFFSLIAEVFWKLSLLRPLSLVYVEIRMFLKYCPNYLAAHILLHFELPSTGVWSDLQNLLHISLWMPWKWHQKLFTQMVFWFVVPSAKEVTEMWLWQLRSWTCDRLTMAHFTEEHLQEEPYPMAGVYVCGIFAEICTTNLKQGLLSRLSKLKAESDPLFSLSSVDGSRLLVWHPGAAVNSDAKQAQCLAG